MVFEQPNSRDRASAVSVPNSDAVAKPPPWRTLIMLDLYCAELAAGLFIAAALGDLVAADIYRAVARIGYILAFPIAFADLLCLVFDLGDPIRFHHMLRVFKLRSPMSTGTWAISTFSLLSFTCLILALINAPQIEKVRAVIGGIGLPVALFVGGYKGVMLSCTAQPVWKAARWLGAELVTSAALMGIAALVVIAVLLPAPSALAGLRRAQLIMLCLNLVFTLIFAIEALPYIAAGRGSGIFKLVALILIGWVAPLILVLVGAVPELMASACLILVAGAAYRSELVSYPHRMVTAANATA
jgi:Ni/Fe-hydrogenase subunit HybB-like protein